MKKQWLRAMLLSVKMLLLLGAFLLGPVGVLADGGVLQSSWAEQTVTVDGQIGASEWSDATVLDITCEGTLAVTAYVKNDGKYLYVAIDDPNDLSDGGWGSEMPMWFDDEPTGAHDGAWTSTSCDPLPGEGSLRVTSPAHCSSPSSCTDFNAYAAGPLGCGSVGPAPGLSGDVSWASGHAQWEARIDLAASPLKASPGETIGFYFGALDVNSLLADGEWPCGLWSAQTWDEPAEYGDLVLAQEPEEEFVPEAGTLLLMGSGLMGLAGYATLRWRTRE